MLNSRRAVALKMFQRLDELGTNLWRVSVLDRMIIAAVHHQELASGGAVLMNSAAIARATGLPTETARRRVNTLIDLGILQRLPTGIAMADLEKANGILDEVIGVVQETADAFLK